MHHGFHFLHLISPVALLNAASHLHYRAISTIEGEKPLLSLVMRFQVGTYP